LPPCWRFENVVFDQAQALLTVAGQPVAIEPRPLQLLAVLLAHVDQVVTKEALFETVWGGRVTVDNVLANAVTKLRRALGEQGAARIVNLPRIGYRLAGPVQRVDPEMTVPAPDSGAPPPGLRRLPAGLRSRWAGGCAALAAALALCAMQWHDARQALQQARLAAVQARQVREFLRQDLLLAPGTSCGPAASPGTVPEGLTKAARRAAQLFPDQPLVEGEIRLLLGDCHMQRRAPDAAADEYGAAVRLLATDRARELAARYGLARAWALLSRGAQARRLLSDAQARQAALGSGVDAELAARAEQARAVLPPP